MVCLFNYCVYHNQIPSYTNFGITNMYFITYPGIKLFEIASIEDSKITALYLL